MSNKKDRSLGSKLDIIARILSGNLKISYAEAIQLARLQYAELAKVFFADQIDTTEGHDQAARKYMA